MQYGYFDSGKKEYVITKPDTPAPWVNYLGSPEYGAIISNNATGYSFKQSGANGRVVRHRFNSMSNDAPGRYIYLKDMESQDYWSGSWSPVCKPQEEYKSECRHGMGYTVISSEYKDIQTETTYFVPLGETYEVWQCQVKNKGLYERRLSVTGYAAFVNHSNYAEDQVDLQCSLFLTRTSVHKCDDGTIMHQMHNLEPNVPPMERFFALIDGAVSAYCGDRDVFLGTYRGYGNPIGVERGLQNELNYNGNSCGALQCDIVLKPGESKTFTYVLGQHDLETAKKIVANYQEKRKRGFDLVQQQLENLKEDWDEKLDGLIVHTPDEDFNNMVNVWNAYNCYMTFIWSRAASLIYCGLRNGYGYRDTVQDIQGIIHLSPALAKEKIVFMLSAQTTCGAGLPLVKFDHKAGFEDTPDDDSYVRATGHPHYRADDALWLFPTIYKYISESGDLGFLDEQILLANENRTISCYEHLKLAIDFSMNHLGAHGLPVGLHADWNDGLRLGEKGESMFVAFQLVLAIRILQEYAEQKDDCEYLNYLGEIDSKISRSIESSWNVDRWIRGYRGDGTPIGTREDEEASLWLNPQSWSVIAGFGDKKSAEMVMDLVKRELNTPHGAMLFYPPYDNHAFKDVTGIRYFNACTKENGGIFSQPQGWLILAEALLGRGNHAYRYWKEICPASYNDKAELRVIEPYVHGQFTEGKDSPFAGRSHVHWLTGTASTVMVGTVEGILGLRPNSEGLIINPSIPSEWKEFTMEKKFRGKTLFVTVKNPEGKESGVSSVSVNGQTQNDLLISEEILREENKIEVILG